MPEDTEDSLSPETKAEHEHKEGRSLDELAAKEQRIEELTDTLKRTQAEFENYKKRVEREVASKGQLASEGLVSDLLPILDTLDEGIADLDDLASTESSKEGLEGIRRQFIEVLRRAGLREISTDGQFDPFLHEAMMREETDSVDEGIILEVFQKGYMLGPKVVRAAKVKVSARALKDHTAEYDDNQITKQEEEDD
ncbi:TPA: nucleotide exchange factor GrpE [Thermoplasmata archaeon]|nr:nucleotide exchange factor GrpE [Thermoplasmata archaeon]